MCCARSWGKRVDLGVYPFGPPSQRLAPILYALASSKIQICTERRTAHARRRIPVSYTHLDVYKRQIDAVVCNAGIAEQKLFQNITDADWMRMLDVNLMGTVRTIRAVLPDCLLYTSRGV